MANDLQICEQTFFGSFEVSNLNFTKKNAVDIGFHLGTSSINTCRMVSVLNGNRRSVNFTAKIKFHLPKIEGAILFQNMFEK